MFGGDEFDVKPIYQQPEAWEMPYPNSNDLIQILLGTHPYTEDAYIYNLASNACFTITNLHQTVYSPPLAVWIKHSGFNNFAYAKQT